MSDGNGLINLGDLSKPATVLIERISDAVGGLAKPWQITRVARAEARADVIRAQTRAEISEIEERAILRMVREEGQKQENMENITALAMPLVSSEAEPEKVEKDWLAHFFDKSRLVSDVEMQAIWANILSGEANKPGSFARKTVDIVSSLEKADAHLFANLCKFSMELEVFSPVIPELGNKIFSKSDINFSTLSHLDDIGLIKFNSITGFTFQNVRKYSTVRYAGVDLVMELPDARSDVEIGPCMFTKAGRELASVCEIRPDNGYLDYIIGTFANRSIIFSSPVFGGFR